MIESFGWGRHVKPLEGMSDCERVALLATAQRLERAVTAGTEDLMIESSWPAKGVPSHWKGKSSCQRAVGRQGQLLEGMSSLRKACLAVGWQEPALGMPL